jgi:bifunctional UDP-N-acetylglucosamine pyrophosphorylase/glucosamine-1-phosphate N-acetyltransferase
MTATAIILAAGLGTRMKSAVPKTLHPIAGRPMLQHLLDSCRQVFDRIVVVIGPGMDQLAEACAPHEVVVQHDRLGTAHAALQAEALFGPGGEGHEVAVLYADNPLISARTLGRLLARRGEGDVGLALLAMRPADPARYGRVLTEAGYVTGIVEYADATAEQREIRLCNAGVLCAEAGQMRQWLQSVQPNNAKGEYYLTDLVTLANTTGRKVASIEAAEDELRGINSRAELAAAEASVQRHLRLAAMEAGVTLVAPETVFFSFDTRIEADVTVEPNVVFGPGVVIQAGARIRAFSHLEGCHVGPDAIIGPYARLRPGTVIGTNAHVGNFVELKATHLGNGAKANHLSYLGDSEIGARTNIGAGTITCNYDGTNKHRTSVGEDAFIGSNSVLVAPVTIGNGAFTTAGSVITQNVEPDAMAFARASQVNKPGRAAAFRAARPKK